MGRDIKEIKVNHTVVLDKGLVSETGKHANLLESKGLYFHLWEEQHRTQRWRIGS